MSYESHSLGQIRYLIYKQAARNERDERDERDARDAKRQEEARDGSNDTSISCQQLAGEECG